MIASTSGFADFLTIQILGKLETRISDKGRVTTYQI